MADQKDLRPTALEILAANSYLTLATTDTEGQAWATPVWFAARGTTEFVWVSRPGARHSRNVAAVPTIGIVVFDSSAPVGEAAAVYAEADAAQVDDADLADALAVYNEASLAAGLPPWGEATVTGSAQFRLYRARAREVFLLDDHDQRVPVVEHASPPEV